MKKLIICMIITISTSFCANSQSIRKNYREMTESEKIDLVNAFYQLRLGADLVNDLSLFHRNFFNLDDEGDGTALDIHFNLPDEPEREIFLAWHRRQIFELEQAMQDLYPRLSIPYADWSLDNSIDSPIWDETFMGQFDEDWNLNRNLGGISSLPNSSDITDVQNFSSDFQLFSNNFERGVVHAGPHNWIGGVMGGSSSPRDPVFYLHHTFVDKQWDDWEKSNNNSDFQRTSMLRYDGTYNFNGETLPLVNPNSIVNTISLGVFYASNQLVTLENYEINNIYRSLEKFYYQYTIQLGVNFKIPTDKNCMVESITEILIKPGFHAENGSNFYATIDRQNSMKSSLLIKNSIVRNQIPFDELDDTLVNVYGYYEIDKEIELQIVAYPNPVTDYIIIKNTISGKIYEVIIYDTIGNLVFNEFFINNSSPSIEIKTLDNLRNGLYFLLVKNQNNLVLKSKFVKQ